MIDQHRYAMVVVFERQILIFGCSGGFPWPLPPASLVGLYVSACRRVCWRRALALGTWNVSRSLERCAPRWTAVPICTVRSTGPAEASRWVMRPICRLAGDTIHLCYVKVLRGVGCRSKAERRVSLALTQQGPACPGANQCHAGPSEL